ncbi:MAG: hypothetical protein JXA15_07070 [Spirochaetales bacterium]|nr:hypothetical protein [Spirochaetales bacterium]
MLNRLKMAAFSAVLALAALAPCAAQGAGAGAEGPRGNLRVDLRPVTLGISSGGFGLSGGWEGRLGARFSALAMAEYQWLGDASVSTLIAYAGPRFSFDAPALEGFLFGAYPMLLYGVDFGTPVLGYGFMLELAWAWVPEDLPRLLVEPYVKYPYLFGEDPLVGVAPGISFGWNY